VVAKIGNRTREEWDRFAETYYGYVLPTAQLKELISEAFDSRGLRDGLEKLREVCDRLLAAARYTKARGGAQSNEVYRILLEELPAALRAEASKLDGEERCKAFPPSYCDKHYHCGHYPDLPCHTCGHVYVPEPPAEEREHPANERCSQYGLHRCAEERKLPLCPGYQGWTGDPTMDGRTQPPMGRCKLCGQPLSSHEPAR
jgi:hypothetical protein